MANIDTHSGVSRLKAAGIQIIQQLCGKKGRKTHLDQSDEQKLHTSTTTWMEGFQICKWVKNESSEGGN